jgi:hypothetical protein
MKPQETDHRTTIRTKRMLHLLAAFGVRSLVIPAILWQSAGAQQADAPSLPDPAPLTAEQVIHNLAKMNLHRDQSLHAYHATRTYQVEYYGFLGMKSAEIVVGVTYLSPGKKEFVIGGQQFVWHWQ